MDEELRKKITNREIFNYVNELETRVKWYEKKYGSYIEKRGLHNWKNLFRKPNNYEWTILFMILMALFIGWAYQIDTQQCRETLNKIEGICIEYCSSEFSIERAEQEATQELEKTGDINLSLFIFKAENSSSNE
jgi:hypothetical protein